MRIIAGQLGGRVIQSPHGRRTHPMSERVRGGLFNTLGELDGLTGLDAFAGSGALSLEAISRGAKHITAIDVDKKAQAIIKKNAETLGVSQQISAILANASAWSDNNPELKFDIVIAAPPYDNLQLKLIEKLTLHVVPGGLYVLDWPGKQTLPELNDLELITEKNYGDAQLGFYRKP